MSKSRVARRFYSPSWAEIGAQFAFLVTGPNEAQFGVRAAKFSAHLVAMTVTLVPSNGVTVWRYHGASKQRLLLPGRYQHHELNVSETDNNLNARSRLISHCCQVCGRHLRGARRQGAQELRVVTKRIWGGPTWEANSCQTIQDIPLLCRVEEGSLL